MKLYLSSMGVGDKTDDLVRMMSENKRMAYIPNACDYTAVDWDRRNAKNAEDMGELRGLGLIVKELDLQDYFGKTDKLREELDKFGGVFIRGGNTFILRQAMKLSGFDKIFEELITRDDFVYSGYSAGICVLAPDMHSLQIVDDPHDMPYKQLQETIWKGLGYLDYMILPHYQSDHPESADIDKEVEYCKQHNIPYKTLRDGEVIVIE